ncbi:MAG TPA: hypothetical protein VFI13_09610, partial [Gemmatimonadales bacterium]|nr:hypothetical protein [Gemmatimonadales bacterium]
MFTYQLPQPRRSLASAFQAAFIHASLVAGAVVATKAVPTEHHSSASHEMFYTALVTDRPHTAAGGSTIADVPIQPPIGLPELPKLRVDLPRSGGPVVDPRSVVDVDSLLPATGDPLALGSATSVIDESVVDDPPTLLVAAPVRYPAVLQAAGVEGTVTLSFVIDTLGHVEPKGIEVVNATVAGFVPAAREG